MTHFELVNPDFVIFVLEFVRQINEQHRGRYSQTPSLTVRQNKSRQNYETNPPQPILPGPKQAEQNRSQELKRTKYRTAGCQKITQTQHGHPSMEDYPHHPITPSEVQRLTPRKKTPKHYSTFSFTILMVINKIN